MTQSMNMKSLSPSMMTFKDYYMAFVGIKDQDIISGWGWFVDIELNSEPIKIIKNPHYKKNPYNYRASQYVSIPDTIYESKSIRSMKSMQNLCDTSMIFEMDEDDYEHRTNKSCYTGVLSNTLGIIGILICYFMTYGSH